MINPLNTHYSFTNPASIHDEEALTALELAGRQGAKINEVVNDQNALRQETEEHLEQQDSTIEQRMNKQDADIENIRTVTVPADVDKEMQKQINNGTFDSKINQYIGNLEQRVDNILNNIPEGGTTSDAELLDVRVSNEGVEYENAGTATRAGYTALANRMNNVSVYSLDLVKKTMGLEEIFNGDIEHNHVNADKTWQFTSKTFDAEPGKYTLIIDDMHLSEVGYVAIAHTTTGIKFSSYITEPGVYEIKIYDFEEGFHERTILFQSATDTLADAGVYFARGIHIYKGWVSELQGLPDILTGADKRLLKVYGKNLFNPASITEGYFLDEKGQPRKELPEYPGFYYSDYMEVEAGETYAITLPYLGGAYIAFYDSGKVVCSDSDGNFASWTRDTLTSANGIITAPDNARYLRISGRVAEINQTQVEKGSTPTAYQKFTDYAPLAEVEQRVENLEQQTGELKAQKKNVPDFASVDSLTDGETLSIASPHSKCGNHIGFSGNFESFGSLTISHGKTNPYCSGYMVLDASTLKVYSYTTQAVQESSVEHGLTLAGNVFIDISTEYKKAHIRITSSGETFETDAVWNGSNGDIIAECSNMTMTDCLLSYFIADLGKDLWCFGDSYFDHWCEYVESYGYHGGMLDAFSGRGSLSAISSLNMCLEKATPKKIAWFMGMNDGDSDSAVSSSWMSAYNTLTALCEQYGIELILSTIPNTPTINHTFKNEIVKSSGYRYIDLCHAVGADVSTSWDTGLLSTDNVHATPVGRMVIANYILAMLPELKG